MPNPVLLTSVGVSNARLSGEGRLRGDEDLERGTLLLYRWDSRAIRVGGDGAGTFRLGPWRRRVG